MRVMMIGPFPLSPERIDGGVAAAMTYLAQALVAGHGAEVVGVRIGASREPDPGRRTFSWPVLDLPIGKRGLVRDYWRERSQLDGLIRRFRPDILHGQGIDLPGLLAVRAGGPSIVTVHGIIREETQYLPGRVERMRARLAEWMIERRTLRNAREVISISPFVTRYYGAEIRGRVHDIPNPIAPGHFSLCRAPERGRLLFAGRLIERKGVLDLVRALALVPEAFDRLILAGAAPQAEFEQRLRGEIESLGLTGRVEFAGLLEELALRSQLARAEALVLPSYRETAPMVVQQALAAGLAVVASTVGGVPDQLQDGVSGLLFEAGNVEQLAAIVRRLHVEPDLAQQLGSAGRDRAHGRYEAETVAAATLAAYDQVIASWRKRN